MIIKSVFPFFLIHHFVCHGSHSLAVDQEGKVWAWGRNSDGELGLGDFIRRLEPSLLIALLPHWITKVTMEMDDDDYF